MMEHDKLYINCTRFRVYLGWFANEFKLVRVLSTTAREQAYSGHQTVPDWKREQQILMCTSWNSTVYELSPKFKPETVSNKTLHIQ